ncbi:F-box domain-containing protein [Artemisia annua]|uniref:F-box domain-containing protein n=1 Tax=Artemisia annua TaxID=35608 RepID=A0A2U1LW84_ARTAN|nr:F-box domain-containing protein [Artemisia annua]
MRAYKYLSNSKYQAQSYIPHSDAIGFYKDSLNDCYKILHVHRNPSGSCMAYIYSQRLDTWKKIEFLENAKRFSKGHDWSPVTFANGSLYFTIQGSQGARSMVISFDVNSEKFKEIQCPSGAKKCANLSGRLVCVVVKDCIHLCVSSGMKRDSYWQYELDLWRLNGEEGWTKVESISVKDRYTQGNHFWIPICIVRNVEWLVLGECDGSFYTINMKTKELAHLYDCSWLDHEGYVNTIQRAIYIETLVSSNPKFE